MEDEIIVRDPEGINASGSIRLSSLDLQEFHLPGQHDQSAHGSRGKGKGGGTVKGINAGEKLTSNRGTRETAPSEEVPSTKLPSQTKGWPNLNENREFEDSSTGFISKKHTMEVETANNKKIKLVEHKGNGATGLQREEMLGTTAYLNEIYPKLGVSKIDLVDAKSTTAAFGYKEAGKDVNAWTDTRYSDRIFVNGDYIPRPPKGHMMPTSQTVPFAQYVVAHEIGHQYHLKNSRDAAIGLFQQPKVKMSLSKYGQSNELEAYAESFAEWHISQGKTKNPAARAYAKHEGWFGEGGLRASGFIQRQRIMENLLAAAFAESSGTKENGSKDSKVTKENGSKDSKVTKENGSKDSKVTKESKVSKEEGSEDDIDFETAFKPFEGAITIVERFLGRPAVIGPEAVPATKEALSKAEKIAKEVWKELELDWEEGEGTEGEEGDGTEEVTGSIALIAPMGSIALIAQSPQVTEFHLPGQHDQKAHGRKGGGSKLASMGDDPRFTSTVNAAIRKEGQKASDYDDDGKPVVGTDSWRDAHGISKGVYDARPMVQFKDSKDPVFDELYKDFPPEQKRFAKRVAGSSDGGLIMVRKPAPGALEAGFGPIPPQIRPNTKVALNPQVLRKKEIELESAKARREVVNDPSYTADDVIKERQTRVNSARRNVLDITGGDVKGTVERADYKHRVAMDRLSAAEKDGGELDIARARSEVSSAFYERKAAKHDAFTFKKDPVLARGIAEETLRRADEDLQRAKDDPKGSLKGVKQAAELNVHKKEKQLDKASVKYLFPPGEGNASRIEVNQDAQNIKNLVSGKGRVYFPIEGNIKADAVLSQVKREDPTAAVISVPSVTAWPHQKDAELDWVSKKYLKGRDIILIPDSDGVINDDVMKQATQMQGRLQKNGVGRVFVAAPPLEGSRSDQSGWGKDAKGRKTPIQKLFHPTGVEDERKGVDDHLGLGKGTLGDLTFAEIRPPKIVPSDLTSRGKINRQAIPNASRALESISALAGEKGISRISKNSIEKHANMPGSSVGDSVKKLETLGIIKTHHIFDPQQLARKRREPMMSFEEIKKLTKRAGVSMPDLESRFLDDDFDYEVSPIIEILDRKFIATVDPPRKLSGVIGRLKNSRGAPKLKSSGGSGRIVRTAEGAKLYGIPVGSEIPVASATGTITLSSHENLKLAPKL